MKQWRFTIIPYDPRACEFFTDTLLSMCKLDFRMNEFFGNPMRVSQAIDARCTPALMG